MKVRLKILTGLMATFVSTAGFADNAAVLETAPRLGKPSPIKVSGGPAVSLLNGALGFGAAAAIQFHTGFSELYFGFESGFYRWAPTPGNRVSGDVVRVIPLLATLTYRFVHQSGFHPYVGIAAGAAFASGNPAILGSSSSSETLFEALFRPGVEIESTSGIALFFEPKIGFLGRGNFVVLPQLGFSFAL